MIMKTSPSSLLIPASEDFYRSAAASLAAPPSGIGCDIATALLERHYGLSGSIARLSSETETTDAITLSDGRQLILKTSTRPEALDSFRFQSAALQAVADSAGFVTSKILPTTDGALMFTQDGVHGYLQTRLAGVPLHQAQAGPDLLFQVGCALARLGERLGAVNLPGAQRPVLWHVGCWPRLMAFAEFIADADVAGMVDRAMRDHQDHGAPRLADLPWQATHNDPSPHNVLLSERGIGFIDFGDGGFSPRVQDLAIAAAHAVTDPALALGGAEHLIAGYTSVTPLSTLERQMLVDLMRARQSALILVNYWRAHLFPAEAQYITKNVARAEHGLRILSALSPDERQSAADPSQLSALPKAKTTDEPSKTLPENGACP